ncbi:FeoA family protein [Winogradskyella sp. A3E31]|uniref:FeoA family protein n=1 Tax=Winogradskyella sp. A3E31 TaxID=3349637 RepID=UPI00398AAEE3
MIKDVSSVHVPLKLLEMGCLPGNSVKLVQVAPFADPMYLNINGTHLAIRKETALHILIEATNE